MIDASIEKVNRSYDARVAPLRAKSLLVQYFKKQQKVVSVELKHFQLMGVRSSGAESIFSFKVKKSHIKVNENQ